MHTRVPQLIFAMTAAVLLSSSCGKRVPEPANLTPGTPHISWVFMSGDRDTPDRDFVCQSDPRTECVFPVSTPAEQTLAHLHFYYHGAGAETNYIGTIQVGLFDGSAEVHRFSVKIGVKKEESITNQSIVDRLTTTPGTYAVTFDIVATTGNGANHPIREQVSVTVR